MKLSESVSFCGPLNAIYRLFKRWSPKQSLALAPKKQKQRKMKQANTKSANNNNNNKLTTQYTKKY